MASKLEEIAEEQPKSNDTVVGEKNFLESNDDKKGRTPKSSKIPDNSLPAELPSIQLSQDSSKITDFVIKLSPMEIQLKSDKSVGENALESAATSEAVDRQETAGKGQGVESQISKNGSKIGDKNQAKSDRKIDDEEQCSGKKEKSILTMWPILDGPQQLWNRRGEQKFLVSSIEKVYAFVNGIDLAVPTISEELFTSDSETIWQQIAYGNRKFLRYCAKRKELLDVEVPQMNRTNPKSDFSKKVDERTEPSDDDDAESSDECDVDLFNLSEKQIRKKKTALFFKDLERDESEEDDDDEMTSEASLVPKESDAPPKKRWKSAVDDRFFSLAEMEEYLERQEKSGADNAGDSSNAEADYHYADFFGNEEGPNEFVMESNTEKSNKLKKLKERIASIEAANLAPRSWEMSGEVTAMEREENTMLEKHFDFDQSAPKAPIVTVDSTFQLEAMIIQRIKDKAFDDVVRTERKLETNTSYRAPVVEETAAKKSLAEVYEEHYQKINYGEGSEEKKNEKHETIKKLMLSLFQKLDALSHYRYIPSEVQPEVRIVSNMPSLKKEEVGPMASSANVLLAPEEVRRHASGPPKADEEKTKTDRFRARRKKKKWQRSLKSERQQPESSGKTGEAPSGKRKLLLRYDNKGKSTKLTSTSFFSHLQAAATEEVGALIT
ncbi:unnamed protein product [Gongylonema pulchrum]|uniref:U3 small nucleolar ribonucleoprotein protein MPP10 n=1 Tax=Gongylonema pulchrum TaxID=637853 RepID=A0A183DRG9_9BILA|nr:unnamed protein product [Gongylonema pulchrum]